MRQTILPDTRSAARPIRRFLAAWQQTIRGKMLLAFAVMTAIIALLGGFATLTIRQSAGLVAMTFDRSLMSVSYARSAEADFAEMKAALERQRHSIGMTGERALKDRLDAFSQRIGQDLRIAAARAHSAPAARAAADATAAVARWQAMRHRMPGQADTAAPLAALDAAADRVNTQIERLIDLTAGDAFLYRERALASIAHGWRMTACGTLGALLLAAFVTWMLARCIVRPVAAVSGAVRGLQLQRTSDGRVIAIMRERLADGGWIATFEGVTEQRRTEAQILHMARHDALTGLPNRLLFSERLEQALAQLPRGTGFAVHCLDLDRFKEVNDTLGHDVGDLLLREVAARFLSCARETDTVGRLGSDEFAIVQAGIARPDDAAVLAQRVLQIAGEPYDVAGQRIVIGASCGIAVPPGNGTSAETLLRNADTALYRAKADGRGIWRFFEPEMNARLQLRRALETDLRAALAADALALHFQPLIDVAAGAVCGCEALLRWRHPARGMISPADFVPIAEETGLILPIGKWVLHRACREAASWPAPLMVAVNVSPVQFRSPDLTASVEAALDASGLDPGRLELEITESVLLHDNEATIATLHELRVLGVQVALDDFGTGYASLSYLRSFPFDKIKIDQSFVRDMLAKEESASIVRAITGLARSLGMRVIAEGVETVEQRDRLRRDGCTEMQGFLFSRPRPAAEIPALLRHWGRTVRAVA